MRPRRSRRRRSFLFRLSLSPAAAAGRRAAAAAAAIPRLCSTPFPSFEPRVRSPLFEFERPQFFQHLATDPAGFLRGCLTLPPDGGAASPPDATDTDREVARRWNAEVEAAIGKNKARRDGPSRSPPVRQRTRLHPACNRPPARVRSVSARPRWSGGSAADRPGGSAAPRCRTSAQRPSGQSRRDDAASHDALLSASFDAPCVFRPSKRCKERRLRVRSVFLFSFAFGLCSVGPRPEGACPRTTSPRRSTDTTTRSSPTSAGCALPAPTHPAHPPRSLPSTPPTLPPPPPRRRPHAAAAAAATTEPPQLTLSANPTPLSAPYPPGESA